MSYDGYVSYNGVEIINVARTAKIAAALGISSVRVRPSMESMLTARFGAGLGDITQAPWYDAQHPASQEFAGLLTLRIDGLPDSSSVASATEYLSDGGAISTPRNATQPFVFSAVLVAKTDRGADFGKRWLDRMLTREGKRNTGQGAVMKYLPYASSTAPLVHRNAVGLTRGVSVTRQRRGVCSSLWVVTFTLTAGDPLEYGEPTRVINSLGNNAAAAGPGVNGSGTVNIVYSGCPVYDYSPIYDPLYPALVAVPTPPNFYPDGWALAEGQTFKRYWATTTSVEPSSLNVVPVIKIRSTGNLARSLRILVWNADTSSSTDQCNALFGAVITYLPPDIDMYIDTENRAAYTWDGFSEYVRRSDSLVYDPSAAPIDWDAVTSTNLRVALDVFGYQANDAVSLSLDLVPVSD